MVGSAESVGISDGAIVGEGFGASVGDPDGLLVVGIGDGWRLNDGVKDSDGRSLGCNDGSSEGAGEGAGLSVGFSVGISDGSSVVGKLDGELDGTRLWDGDCVSVGKSLGEGEGAAVSVGYGDIVGCPRRTL